VLAALGLDGDIVALAADDKVGRKLQDLALESPASGPRRRGLAEKSVAANESAKPS